MTAPIKVSEKYTCATCKYSGAVPKYEVATKSGSIKRKCWDCLTPAEKQAYQAANPVRTECKCGAALAKTSRGMNICSESKAPPSLCNLTKTA